MVADTSSEDITGITMESYRQSCEDSKPQSEGLDLKNIKSRRSGKLVNKRSHLKGQDMHGVTEPLRVWLEDHKHHPYPTKTEKALLALGSQMTLLQVSNWFANARRRLKCSVYGKDLRWRRRAKVTDPWNGEVADPWNGEEMSLSSEEDAQSDDDVTYDAIEQRSKDTHRLRRESEQSLSSRPPSSSSSGVQSPHLDHLNTTKKHKHSIMQRYLNDSLEHAYKSDPMFSHRLPLNEGQENGYQQGYQQLSIRPDENIYNRSFPPSSALFQPRPYHYLPVFDQSLLRGMGQIWPAPIDSRLYQHGYGYHPFANNGMSLQGMHRSLPRTHIPAQGIPVDSKSIYMSPQDLPMFQQGIQLSPQGIHTSPQSIHMFPQCSTPPSSSSPKEQEQYTRAATPVEHGHGGMHPVLSSGSLSSQDYEDVSQSAQEDTTKKELQTHFPASLNESLSRKWSEKLRSSDISQEEIDAALALTNMSRGIAVET